jgi:2-polyprenyl-3-methyl-5-hydroxy-6-metoxy-1,4-benzoquinol methylase
MSHPINPSYTVLRTDILRYIPDNAKRILDVGCSVGSLGKALKKSRQVEIVGIEADQQAAKICSRWLDKVIVGSADDVDLAEHNIPEKYFDCIVYGDVLEHCIDPWSVVEKHRSFLSDEGTIIASIPNVRHYTLIFNLLKGDFPYRNRGLQDKTHLRWFTRRTMVRLFRQNNYNVRIVQRNYRIIEKGINTSFARYANFAAKYLASILYPLRDFLVFQYILECKPIT